MAAVGHLEKMKFNISGYRAAGNTNEVSFSTNFGIINTLESLL